MPPYLTTVIGILIPFFGTAMGAAAVFLIRKNIGEGTQKILFGFASGVMLAATVWSLLLPALETSSPWLPLLGLIAGMATFLFTDYLLSRNLSHADSLSKTEKNLSLAVTIHNVPEGMAVGAAFAAAYHSSQAPSFEGAFLLAVGIALQNFPEGAIISLPLAALGRKKGFAFSQGALSGAVEPFAALLTFFLTPLFLPLLPFFLSFAAGAMLYVIVVELIPEINCGGKKEVGCIGFLLGFSLMMILDVTLGK